MTIQYNIITYGSLTNTDGVLSGFSTSNYATTPSSFTFSSYNWEFNIKFTTGNDVSSDQNIVTPLMENNVDKDAVNIWVNNSAISINIYDNANDELIISGSLACSINTTYYIRCQYISGIYYIKYSSDGINYTDISTPVASALYIWETNQKWVFGLARGVNRPFLGSIDLNYCYLKINNTLVWRGVTKTSQVISHIQLRHDTAANWTSVNPVLLEGEVGIETDTKKQKIGDGSTPWNGLQYDLGSTALQSITSSDVTNALGYTPVNKAGDTMTGNLNFSNSGQSTISLNGIATSSYADITYKDGSNNRLAHLRAYNDSSTKRRVELVAMNDNGIPAGNGVRVTYENGAESCEFPDTKCCDGQWVNCFVQLTTITAIGNYQIDLTNYLPNDGYKYEIMVSGQVFNSNSTYGSVYLNNAHGYDGEHNAARVGTNCRTNCINCTLPVDSSRNIYMKITGHAIAWETHDDWTGLYLVGYRRIGTNS